jgi:hypothetical protein
MSIMTSRTFLTDLWQAKSLGMHSHFHEGEVSWDPGSQLLFMFQVCYGRAKDYEIPV